MSEEVFFRNSVFGGFNREDVSLYIQRLTQSHAEELERLKAQIFDLQKQAESAGSNISSEGETRILALTDQITVLETENTKLKAENNHLSQEIVHLTEENQKLCQTMSEWEPSIENYSIIRSQIGDIELDARSRSTALMNRTEENIRNAYLAANGILKESAENYDRAGVEVSSTIAFLIQELQRIEEELDHLQNVMSDNAEKLKHLRVSEEA